MHLLIAFDISDDQHRRKVVKLLEKQGVRMQMSLFEVRLTRTQWRALSQQIGNLIDKTDRVHYLPLCPKDLGRRAADGKGQICYFNDYFIVE